MHKKLSFIILIIMQLITVSSIASNQPQPSSSTENSNNDSYIGYYTEVVQIPRTDHAAYFKAAMDDKVAKSVCKILGRNRGSGSGVFCQINGMKFVLSAAHLQNPTEVIFYLKESPLNNEEFIYFSTDITKTIPLVINNQPIDLQILFLKAYPDFIDFIDLFSKDFSGKTIINIDRIKPLELNSDPSFTEKMGIKTADVYGYGLTFPKKNQITQLFSEKPVFGLPSKITNNVQKTSLFSLPMNQIIDSLTQWFTNTQKNKLYHDLITHLPAGTFNMTDPKNLYHPITSGFSGGPVIINNKVISINSFANYRSISAPSDPYAMTLNLAFTPIIMKAFQNSMNLGSNNNIYNFSTNSLSLNPTFLNISSIVLNFGILGLFYRAYEPISTLSIFFITLSGYFNNPILNYTSWGMSIFNALYHSYSYYMHNIKDPKDYRVLLPQLKLGRMHGYSTEVAPYFDHIKQIVNEHYKKQN